MTQVSPVTDMLEAWFSVQWWCVCVCGGGMSMALLSDEIKVVFTDPLVPTQGDKKRKPRPPHCSGSVW